jgi:hypothetical protein
LVVETGSAGKLNRPGGEHLTITDTIPRQIKTAKIATTDLIVFVAASLGVPQRIDRSLVSIVLTLIGSDHRTLGPILSNHLEEDALLRR